MKLITTATTKGTTIIFVAEHITAIEQAPTHDRSHVYLVDGTMHEVKISAKAMAALLQSAASAIPAEE